MNKSDRLPNYNDSKRICRVNEKTAESHREKCAERR